uniref:Mid2 domain-containing protein n=1 Tax=Fusarium oxysporum (strain Fo5176) TaxID=660025 RepID=A0A0C4DIL0_FUSOF
MLDVYEMVCAHGLGTLTFEVPVRMRTGVVVNQYVQGVKECASNEFCCNLDQKKDCCKNGAKRFPLKAPEPSSSASESSSPSESTSSSSTPVGAIVGGVIGGIAAFAFLLGLGWWFLHRKKQAEQSDVTHAYASTKSEADGLTPKVTPSPKPPLVEADAGPGQVLVEADAQPSQRRSLHELPA